METIALIGNPNSGKTTLFNRLTGDSGKVGNYSGVTVEKREGHFFSPHGEKIRLLDLPGCYSLSGNSPDQLISRETLLGERDGEKRPDLVVCVVDSSSLERHLLLVLEVIATGLPVVVALNMIDMAESTGLRLDPVKLSEEIGVPVIPIQANVGKGVVELKQAVRHPFPAPREATPLMNETDSLENRQQRVLEICSIATRRPEIHATNLSDAIDSVLLHKFFGWVSLIGMMILVFWSIFSFAELPMGLVEDGFAWIKDLVSQSLPEGDFKDLIVEGMITGVESVVVFLPQIMILFFFIGLLESSGYMARAAFLMDGPMSKIGLSGKAFLPLLSSYACAIPGVMATRTISSAKERLVTIFIAPWMSCSARLPVYFLLIPMLLGGSEGGLTQALVLASVYLLGTLTAFAAARILRGRLGPEEVKQHFLLELPPYRLPQWGYIFRHVIERAGSFLKKAGTVILGISILIWAGMTYPKLGSEDGAKNLEHSVIGRVADVIEPVVIPMGFDGRVGIAILTSFAAREVFNSTMIQIYSVEEDEENEVGTRDRLRAKLAAQHWPDGRKMFTPLTVLSLLIFYIYALQCLPTSTVVARESGSWKWAAGQFLFMSLFAAFASFSVFQLGRLLGFE